MYYQVRKTASLERMRTSNGRNLAGLQEEVLLELGVWDSFL